MAFRFDATKSQYLESAAAAATAYPFTLACWFYSDDLTISQNLIGLYNGSTAKAALQIAGAVAGDPLRLVTGTTNVLTPATTVGYSASTWQHAAGVWASNTDRRVFLDGRNKATAATSIAPGTLTVTSLGRNAVTSPNGYLSGQLAKPAIWAATLSDDEVAWLAQQLRSGRQRDPWEIRRADLVFGRRLRMTINAPRIGCPDLAAFGTSNDPPQPIRDARVDAPPADPTWLYAATAAGGASLTASGSFAGTATLSATAVVERFASGSVAGVATPTATATREAIASGSVAGSGSLTATATVERFASGSFAGSGSLAATAIRDASASGSLAGTSALAVAATREAIASGSVAGVGGFAATATATAGGTAGGSIAASSILTATATAERFASGSFAAVSALTGTATREAIASGTLGGVSAFVATADREAVGTGVITAVSTLAATATRSGRRLFPTSFTVMVRPRPGRVDPYQSIVQVKRA